MQLICLFCKQRFLCLPGKLHEKVSIISGFTLTIFFFLNNFCFLYLNIREQAQQLINQKQYEQYSFVTGDICIQNRRKSRFSDNMILTCLYMSIC